MSDLIWRLQRWVKTEARLIDCALSFDYNDSLHINYDMIFEDFFG